jgi:hypothetical protein
MVVAGSGQAHTILATQTSNLRNGLDGHIKAGTA